MWIFHTHIVIGQYCPGTELGGVDCCLMKWKILSCLKRQEKIQNCISLNSEKKNGELYICNLVTV